MEKHNNIYVDMVGDLFHMNHVRLFKEAKDFGNNLFIGIHSDESVQNYKCTPILTMNEPGLDGLILPIAVPQFLQK